METYPLPEGEHPIPDDVQLPPKWVLRIEEEDHATPGTRSVPETHQHTPKSGERPRLDHDIRPIPDTLTATLTQNKRVTPSQHWQDVRHLCLTVPDEVSYVPGDVIAITPKNFADDVEAMIKMMGWEEQADQLVSLAPNVFQAHVDEVHGPPIAGLPSYPRLTLRALIMDYLDLRAIPRRAFFSAIAHYTNDDMHRERLLEFTSPDPEFLNDLWDYTTRPRRSILEVLHEFDSVRIPWQHAAAVLPVFRARQFSIASGGALKRSPDGGTQFELLIAIVKYRTVIRRVREGVCTRYIAALQPGSTLQVQLQRGGLHSPREQLLRPTILIGPGTGVAPLRSMLWEKAAVSQALRAGDDGGDDGDGDKPEIGPSVLIYGARNREADFFFEDEWARLAEACQLQVLAGFSRDQPEKVYVQDLVRRNAALCVRLLRDGLGSVYVCGSSGRMPEAVREALIEAFQTVGAESESGGLDRAQAEAYLLGMEKSGRYKQETW